MTNDTLLARSFGMLEQKKFGYGALVVSFFLAISFCTILKPYMGPFNLPFSLMRAYQTVNVQVSESAEFHKIEFQCNRTEQSDYFDIRGDIRGDIRVDGNSATVFITSSDTQIFGAAASAANTSWNIRPYARKTDTRAINRVREWTGKLVSSRQDDVPQCNKYHSVPAVLFSTVGYSDNQFHSIAEIIAPLYLTARAFNGEVQFLITDKVSLWNKKFEKILKALSRYKFIDIDKDNDIHCSRSITIGLKGRCNCEGFSIDSINSSFSMKDFRQFLRSTYSLNKTSAIKIKDGEKTRPRLMIISRKKSRAFTNVTEVAEMATELGYEVLVSEPDADVSRSSQLINSCDVLLGVHGAGLTNIVFLPENAILIQIVPIAAEWASRDYYGLPAIEMNLTYLEYKLKPEESTLIQQYPPDHVVFKDPSVFLNQGWHVFKSIYWDKQDAQLDLNRFRPTPKMLLSQVAPFERCDWTSRPYFEEPTKDMNLRYLKFKMRLEKSTLMQRYAPEDTDLRNPSKIARQSWSAFQAIYLDKQNVMVDLNRFRQIC